MQQQDQTEKIETNEEIESISEESILDDEGEAVNAEPAPSEQTGSKPPRAGLDWPALIAALAVAAFFALTARFNSQPAPSYVPAAVFSATGCGLLVTAIRKLRGRPGAGLLEAGLGGFGMALFQFAITFAYAGVFSTVTGFPEYGRAFLITWGLIALFATVLSLAGATIGHLAFSPLRPLPVRTPAANALEDDEEIEEEDENQEDENRPPIEIAEEAEATVEDENEEDEAVDDEEAQVAGVGTRSPRPLLNYIVTLLLLGLLPMMAGYVFAASYDFMMNVINVNSISPGLYPTLSLLSGLLPWRLAVPINLSNPNQTFIVFTLLWRIPDSALGNPNLLDVQALETLVFNAAGLALLLIAVYGGKINGNQRRPAPLGIFLFLEALFGLFLILPADLWLLRGLEGILQFQQLLAPLPTLQLLNPALFVLNLLTGILFCLIISVIVRRQYQLWTAPRGKTAQLSEE